MALALVMVPLGYALFAAALLLVGLGFMAYGQGRRRAAGVLWALGGGILLAQAIPVLDVMFSTVQLR